MMDFGQALQAMRLGKKVTNCVLMIHKTCFHPIWYIRIKNGKIIDPRGYRQRLTDTIILSPTWEVVD